MNEKIAKTITIAALAAGAVASAFGITAAAQDSAIDAKTKPVPAETATVKTAAQIEAQAQYDQASSEQTFQTGHDKMMEGFWQKAYKSLKSPGIK